MLITSNRTPQVALTKVQVIGERCSGTNLAQKLIQRNLGLEPTLVFDWKHGFPNSIVLPENVLIVACFRNPFDWLLSLHRKPWHTTADIQAMSFSDFIRTPWRTIAERRYKGLPITAEEDGLPLQADRHPITGEVFENAIKLRQAKAAAHLGLANRDCNFAAIRLEDLQKDPSAVISGLSQTFDIAQVSDNYVVRRQLGSRYRPLVERPKTPSEVSAADKDFIFRSSDLALEQRMGYEGNWLE